jgi:hypothetical protein
VNLTAAYRQRRAAALRDGTWQPWTDGRQAREHVAQLRRTGASYREIAEAAGLTHSTVRAAEIATGRVKTETAQALLAVSARDLDPAMADAGGTMLRLRSLSAMGHWTARVAREIRQRPEYLQAIVRGDVGQVPRAVRHAVTEVFERWWDKTPECITPAEERAASAARTRAQAAGWGTPASLDDDRLDVPGYKPLSHYREAKGAGIASPFYREIRQRYEVTEGQLEAG